MRKGSYSLVGVLLVLVCLLDPVGSFLGPPRTEGTGEDAIDQPTFTGPPGAARNLFNGVGDAFQENLGQLDDPAVRFHTQGGRVSIGLTDDGIVVVIRGGGATGDAAAHFSILFDGCERVRPVGRGAVERTTSYFVGNDPARWVRGARSFKEAVYEGLWDGVNLVLRLNDDVLKYDIWLGTGADASKVAFRYEGVEGLAVDSMTGDLVVRTAAGELRDGRPVVFQEGALPSEGAEGRFVIRGSSSVGFELPEGYDPERAVLIDPGLIFSTYIGGNRADALESGDVDGTGKFAICGVTSSSDFPTTNGSFDPEGNVSVLSDACIAVFNSTGSLLHATYIGGSLDDDIGDLKFASDGTILAVGNTDSSDFPVTADALDDRISGPCDGIVLRFCGDLSDLLYGSYFGGSDNDALFQIDIGPDGRICVSGFTDSSDVATTPGAYCATYESTGQLMDSYIVCQLDDDLAHVLYCTYVNGIDTETESFWTEGGPYLFLVQALDAQGNILLGGPTHDASFPTTPGAFQTTYGGGTMDAFVIKLNPAGGGASDLVAGTLIGGSKMEVIMGLLVMDDGRVAIGGATDSSNLPRRRAVDNTLNGTDGYVMVLDDDLTTLEFGTFIGGTGRDFCTGMTRSMGGDALYVLGGTESIDFPCTKGCFEYPRASWVDDYFLVSIDITTPGVEYSTILGGSGHEAFSLAGHQAHLSGDDVLIFTSTKSTDFPTTAGAYQQRYGGGGSDGLVFKFNLTACGLPDPPNDLRASVVDDAVELEWEQHTNIGYRVLNHRVYRGDAPDSLTFLKELGGTAIGTSDHGLEIGRVYYYGVSAVNSMGEGERAVVRVRRLPLPPSPAPLALSSGDGNVTITWTPPQNEALDIQGYRVRRGLSVAGMKETMVTDKNTTTWRDTDVERGVPYYYGVCAFNEAGNGSMVTGSIIPWVPPSPPVGFDLAEHDGMISLSWQRPSEDGGAAIRWYRVYRGLTPDDMGRVIELEARTLSWSDRDVRNGQRYYYHVTAVSESEGASTDTLACVPFGIPQPPRYVNATPGDLLVGLHWSPPESDNGRPITGYVIIWGREPGVLENTVNIGNITSHDQAVPDNGEEYFFQVAAVNEAGTGECSAEASARPLGKPGMVTDLRHELAGGSVILLWDPPLDWGAARSVSYTVYRRAPGLTFVILGQGLVGSEFMDNDTELGKDYTYRVEAANALWSGPPGEVAVLVLGEPDAVTDLALTIGDGFIELRWSAPESDGGSSIVAYLIFRRTSDGTYSQLNWTLLLSYTDDDVVVGKTYWYHVIAKNEMFDGPPGNQEKGTVPTHPGPVVDLQFVVIDGVVELSWQPPDKPWGAAPTGYTVLRGTTTTDLIVIAELGLNQTYRDETIVKEVGHYFYQVRARSAVGPGDQDKTLEVIVGEERTAPVLPWAALLLIIALVVTIAVAVIYLRSREMARVGGPTVHIVEEVLVVLGDGRLIASCGREETRTRDADLMSGMLVAIQGIAREGLERGGMLRSIRYEDNTVVMACGQMVYLAAVVYGTPDQSLSRALEATVQQIEAVHAPTIETWDGDPSAFAGLEEMLRPLIEGTRDVTREDVQRAGAAPDETDKTPPGD